MNLCLVFLISLGTHIFRKYNDLFYYYTNDTQLYMSTVPTAALPHSYLTDCLTEIRKVADKTKMILIGAKSTLAKSNTFTLIKNSIVSPAT